MLSEPHLYRGSLLLETQKMARYLTDYFSSRTALKKTWMKSEREEILTLLDLRLWALFVLRNSEFDKLDDVRAYEASNPSFSAKSFMAARKPPTYVVDLVAEFLGW